MTTIIHRWNDVLKLKAGGMVLPNFADLHVSDICNHECHGCAFREGHAHRYMSLADACKTVDTLMANGVKAFAFCGGGEPFCCPHLPQILQYVRDCGAYFAVMTNGSLLGPRARAAIVQGGTFVRVSLEASDPAAFCAYKGKDDWDKVLANVREMVDTKRKTDSKCTIGIKFAVAKFPGLNGHRHYERGLRIADELGVDRVTFKALRHEDELTAEESEVEDRELNAVSALWNGPAQLTRWIKRWPLDQVPQCWLNPVHTVVNWQGDFFLCCYHYYRHERHRIGNILTDDFAAVWNGEEHRRKIAAIKREECAKVDCKFFRFHADVAAAAANGDIYFV